MQTEHVILLNAQGVPTGTLEKYAAHTADTLLHLAFSCWLFNAKGQLLVTRRALSKKAWPRRVNWRPFMIPRPDSVMAIESRFKYMMLLF